MIAPSLGLTIVKTLPLETFRFRGELGHCFCILLKPLAPLIRGHELFNPGVPAIDNEHTALDIDCNSIGKVELPFAVSEPAPLGDEITLSIELLDPVIAGVRDIDIARSVDRHSPRRPQLTSLL